MLLKRLGLSKAGVTKHRPVSQILLLEADFPKFVIERNIAFIIVTVIILNLYIDYHTYFGTFIEF